MQQNDAALILAATAELVCIFCYNKQQNGVTKCASRLNSKTLFLTTNYFEFLKLFFFDGRDIYGINNGFFWPFPAPFNVLL